MKKLMNILMLSCEKASGLIDKSLHFPLNPIEKIQLFFHTRMCDACRGYQQQSNTMEVLMKQHINKQTDLGDASEIKLSDQSKSQIMKAVKKNK